jgi:hypothetical protein
LQEVVIARQQYLQTIGDLTKPEPQIRDVTALQPTAAPGQPFWVTARVTGAPAIATVELRASVAGPFAATQMFDDGQHRDGAAGDGVYGASFTAPGPFQRMRYYVHATNTAGTVQVHPREAEHVFFSFRSSAGNPPGPIRINELLADNETVDRDEAGDFDDWVELRNVSAQPYDLGGHYLSDDPALPTKWRFPANTIVPAGSYIRVWCDDEPGEGPLHATFKLEKNGEFVVLSDTDGNGRRHLDGVEFPEQKADRTYGRVPDGSGEFFFQWTPSANAPFVVPGFHNRYDGRRTGSARDFDLTARGAARIGQSLNLDLDGGVPNSAAVIALCFAPLKFPLPPLGILGVDPNPVLWIPVALDGSGLGTFSLRIRIGTHGLPVYCQAVNVDLSNALAFIITR